MLRYFILVMALGLSLAGCAQLPDKQMLASYPIITFGEQVPKDKPYILHFIAGKPIPTKILIDGNLLQQSASQTLTVTLARDIYSFKKWASFDGQNWEDARKLLTIKLDIKVPSYQYPHEGHIHLTVDRKQDH